MKRFIVSLISSVLAFTAGIVTASSWDSKRARESVQPATFNIERCPPIINAPVPAKSSVIVSQAPREVDFAQGRLKLVSEKVKLESEILRYSVDLSYPQIVGSESRQIRKVNQHIKAEAIRLYDWTMNPSNSNLPSAGTATSVYNTVNFTYDVNLATESFLSINFMGFSYGRSDFPAQRSFALNYDLKSGAVLKLTDIFRPGSDYLEFISDYCTVELVRRPAPLISDGIAPRASNFESWYMNSNGLSFYFPACKVMPCGEGDQMVQIPFSAMNDRLMPGVPRKFEITYP